jgi:beta-phosphoglucomutase-like phosphatase (HAD superfamily)
MSTRALLVDMDGTLYHQGRVRLGMMWLLARAYLFRPFEGHRVMRALSAYRHAQEALRAAPSDPAIPLDQRQLQHAAAHCRLTRDYLQQRTDRWMLDEPLALLKKARRPGVIQTLAELKTRGWKIAAVSDYPASRKLAALELNVDEIVCAQDPDVQRFKPSPAGIEAALRRLRVDPRNAIYIGDREEVDAPAARAAHVASLILKPREPFPSAATIQAKLAKLH